MITKKNVLIFGGGAYNAQEVYFALRGTVRYNPILASSNDNHSIFIDSNAITDHQAALHQEAVQHPGQQRPDKKTLHSNLSRMRYTAEKRAFQQLTAYPAQKRLHMEK